MAQLGKDDDDDDNDDDHHHDHDGDIILYDRMPLKICRFPYYQISCT
jgi:hypothetical protein